MGSTLALWAYHRRLSLDTQRIKNQDVNRRESLTPPGVSNYSRRTTGRTESECSAVSQPPPPRDRKVSWKTEDSSDEDEEDEQEQTLQQKPETSTPKRRFSLDFLFSRNKKNKLKVGRKRSQSVAVGHEDEQTEVKDHKYPGIHNADFAALYFF